MKAAVGTSTHKGHGIIAWATRQATSSLTHPNMFGYFQTTSENFLFLPMVSFLFKVALEKQDRFDLEPKVDNTPQISDFLTANNFVFFSG